MDEVRNRAEDAAEDRVLDALLPPSPATAGDQEPGPETETRQKFRKMLREGELDDREIEIEVHVARVGRRNYGASWHGRHEPASYRACSLKWAATAKRLAA